MNDERRPSCITPQHDKRPSAMDQCLGLLLIVAFGMVGFIIGFACGVAVVM